MVGIGRFAVAVKDDFMDRWPSPYRRWDGATARMVTFRDWMDHDRFGSAFHDLEKTTVLGCYISTIFLPIQSEYEPFLWETMVFFEDGEEDWQWRDATQFEAIFRHQYTVWRVLFSKRAWKSWLRKKLEIWEGKGGATW